MDLTTFESSLQQEAPPAGLSRPLEALWHDARGDWGRAHDLAQEAAGRDGAWVHAYLHRKEGDAGNAAYWYARADRPVPDQPLEAEWQAIARALLADLQGARR